MSKQVRLNNVLFPIWLLIIFPVSWLIILPGNFIIDSIVLLLTLKILKASPIKQIYIKSVFKIWIFGFLSDFIGAGLLFLSIIIENDWWNEYIAAPISTNPFDNWYSLAFVCLAIIISGIAIYFFNYKFSFKKTCLEKHHKKILALVLAVLTAPYILLFPSQLMYNKDAELNCFTNHIVKPTQYEISVEYLGSDNKLVSKDLYDYNSDINFSLRQSINTADVINAELPQNISTPDYKLCFHNPDNYSDFQSMDVWCVDSGCYFIYDSKIYKLDDDDSVIIKKDLQAIKSE